MVFTDPVSPSPTPVTSPPSGLYRKLQDALNAPSMVVKVKSFFLARPEVISCSILLAIVISGLIVGIVYATTRNTSTEEAPIEPESLQAVPTVSKEPRSFKGPIAACILLALLIAGGLGVYRLACNKRKSGLEFEMAEINTIKRPAWKHYRPGDKPYQKDINYRPSLRFANPLAYYSAALEAIMKGKFELNVSPTKAPVIHLLHSWDNFPDTASSRVKFPPHSAHSYRSEVKTINEFPYLFSMSALYAHPPDYVFLPENVTIDTIDTADPFILLPARLHAYKLPCPAGPEDIPCIHDQKVVTFLQKVLLGQVAMHYFFLSTDHGEKLTAAASKRGLVVRRVLDTLSGPCIGQVGEWLALSGIVILTGGRQFHTLGNPQEWDLMDTDELRSRLNSITLEYDYVLKIINTMGEDIFETVIPDEIFSS